MTAPSFRDDPDQAYALYQEQGYFCEPPIFSAAECNRIIAASAGLPAALDGSFVSTMNVHKTDPIFLNAMARPEVLEIMDRLVHGKANGLHSQFYFTPPERAGLGCHQDNYFVEAKADAFASAWIPLVDITPENGGLYVYVGSQHEGKLPVRSVNAEGKDKRQTVYEETIVPSSYPVSDLRVPRGSVVLLDGYVVHGSHQNHSAGNRYVLLNTYIRAREHFRPGQTARREEYELARA
jgi:ectoine hydroxylase-related dioxygenase (phytanoyl-CoA dioxygenase family)